MNDDNHPQRDDSDIDPRMGDKVVQPPAKRIDSDDERNWMQRNGRPIGHEMNIVTGKFRFRDVSLKGSAAS